MPLRFGSLFSGIGGIDLGLEWAGMQVDWQVEIDDFCTGVLAKHWPGVERFRDVRDVGAHNLAPVDLIAGGFPCQPVSLAGKRRGAGDDRYLWPEMLRIVAELRPTWMLGENVAGLISMGLDGCLSDLEGIGYEARAFVVPACAVDAPHRRDRVWIVAHAEGQPVGTGLCSGEQEGQRGRPPGDGCGTDATAHAQEQRRGPFGAECQGRQRQPASVDHCRWATEPAVGRVAHGLPGRVARLKALGNAVVPQVVAEIGRAIVEAS